MRYEKTGQCGDLWLDDEAADILELNFESCRKLTPETIKEYLLDGEHYPLAPPWATHVTFSYTNAEHVLREYIKNNGDPVMHVMMHAGSLHDIKKFIMGET